MDTPIIQEIEVKSVLSKSNLPVCEYSVNPYVGCPHACQYCYASFMKRFTNHPEPWGDFLDVKCWPKIKNPQKYAGKELFIGSVTDPYNPQEEIYGRTRDLLTQVKCLHRRQPPLNGNGLVHILTESFIQRVNRPGHTSVRKTLYQFQVTQNQIGLGGDTDFRAAPLQLGQQGPCPPIDFLLGIVRVSHRTDEQFLRHQA
mgnify:CR=1 FL=1